MKLIVVEMPKFNRQRAQFVLTKMTRFRLGNSSERLTGIRGL